MDESLKIIQALVAPVVLISANGLVCLALYNRLAAVLTRARTFHKERFDAAAQLAELEAENIHTSNLEHRRQRLEQLVIQGGKLLYRAKLLRAALMLLMFTVLFMIACSAALGLAPWQPVMASVALICFAMGLLAMATGCVLAIIELAHALEPVLDEADSLRDTASF